MWVLEPEGHLRLKAVNQILKKTQQEIWIAAVHPWSETEEQVESVVQVEPEVDKVLQQFREVFVPLEGIPPKQRVQYRIKLETGAKPVIKRPYRLSAFITGRLGSQLEPYSFT